MRDLLWIGVTAIWWHAGDEIRARPKRARILRLAAP